MFKRKNKWGIIIKQGEKGVKISETICKGLLLTPSDIIDIICNVLDENDYNEEDED